MSRRNKTAPVIEDFEEESDEEESNHYDSDDSEGARKKNDSKSTIKLYILTVLTILFCLSYLYERDLRFKLIQEFNDSIDQASVQLYEVRQKLATSAKPSLSSCPKCQICPEEEPVQERSISEADITLSEWAKRDAAIVSELQMLSRELLKTRFGEPPYYVSLDIHLDSETAAGGKIVIEMAPVDLVPYSVLFFLNQVAAGAWNSCSLFINLGVVYLEEARGSTGCNLDGFEHIGGFGAKMAFQEYSPAYRHEELTVGLSGRPAGSGFYISAVNNSKPLGPRGEQLPGGPPLDADPVIGKLVRGQDLYIRMKRLEQNVDGGTQRLFQDIFHFQKAVTITSASVISATELDAN